MTYERGRHAPNRNHLSAPRAAGDTITTSISSCRSASPSAVRPASRLYQRRDTWYEFPLKQFNPDDIDYGSWLKQRRQALLEARVRNPYFTYRAGVTLALRLLTLVIAKERIDHRRSMWITAEMMTDLYNHDTYSGEIARQASERYNGHIEHCNRVIEVPSTVFRGRIPKQID